VKEIIEAELFSLVHEVPFENASAITAEDHGWIADRLAYDAVPLKQRELIVGTGVFVRRPQASDYYTCVKSMEQLRAHCLHVSMT
jgi:hypothetical protein